MPRTKFPCKWLTCQQSFDNPEDLFAHLSDDHIGRKATNNLCLQCQWNGCGTVAAKRDHLASHLRVHLPLKPHQCTLCSKGFKRPQDLKKHERIHTVEHQASLLSNQPGYKPVRRRRKPNTTTPNTTATVPSFTTQPSPHTYNNINKDISEASSDLSSCSPSFSFGDSLSSTDNNRKMMDMDNEEEHQYFSNGYLQQDPLQDFIDDVLQNQSLPPNYDTDMMDRLDSIAPMLQYQNNIEWTLPCEPEAIPALQNWLEQLSANIQTDDNIYPDILTSKSNNDNTTSALLTPPPQQQQESLLSTEDYDLYPKLDDNNVWTSSSSPNKQQQQQATSASESSFVHTPPSYEQHYSSPQSSSSYDNKNVKAQFWSPGYISSPIIKSPSQQTVNTAPPLPPRPAHHPLHNQQQPQQQQQQQENIDYYTPSDAIDFNVIRKYEQAQPNLVFETSKLDAESAGSLTPVLSNQASTFDDKKELVHMINVFSSKNGLKYRKKSDVAVKKEEEEVTTKQEEEQVFVKHEEEQVSTKQEEEELSIKQEEAQLEEASSSNSTRKSSISSSGSSSTLEYPDEDDEDIKSPYADLVGMIANMKVEEEDVRKRHALLVDTLWKRIAQIS